MPASPDMIHYTITGAQDWPMFKEMLGGMRILLGGAWVSTIGLLLYIYRSIISRIASERKGDKEHCSKCQKFRDREFSYVWNALDTVAPRSPHVAAAKVRLEDNGEDGA